MDIISFLLGAAAAAAVMIVVLLLTIARHRAAIAKAKEEADALRVEGMRRSAAIAIATGAIATLSYENERMRYENFELVSQKLRAWNVPDRI